MKRFLCIILAAMMSVGLFCFTSCKDKADEKGNVSVNANITAAEGDLYPDYLPEDLDFGGNTITFLVMGDGYNGSEWASQDIYYDPEVDDTANPIINAVCERNAFLEEKYNVKIKHIPVAQPGNTALVSIKAGSDEYQVIMAPVPHTINLLESRYLRNLRAFDYIDLEQPWWDQTLVKNTSIAGKNYFATGDISIMDNDATWILMFNKKLAEAYDLESPYDLVHNNKWTYDKMNEMMKTVQSDNGNGVIDWDLDTFGMTTHNSVCEAFFYASGAMVTYKDETDYPMFDTSNSYTDYIIRVLEKSQDIYGDASKVFSCNRSGYSLGANEVQAVFESGRALFLSEVMQLVIRLRTMDISFGVIPFPKFDTNQENYGHFIHATTAMLSIPTSCRDYERVGALVEAMAARSMTTLTPAYYDITLEGKGFRDEESSEMLDIILKSRTFDLGGLHMFNWGNIGNLFSSQLSTGANTYSSQYKRSATRAATMLNKTIANIEAD